MDCLNSENSCRKRFCAGVRGVTKTRESGAREAREAGAWTRRLGMFFVVFMLVTPLVAGAGEEGTAEKGSVRIVGPESAEKIIMTLADEYAEAAGEDADGLRVRYEDKSSASSAGHSFVRGKEVMVSWGRVGGKFSRRTQHRWEELSPDATVVGARAIAFVVHGSNGIDSLSMDQLEGILGGQISEWGVFGGSQGSIRCYGPPYQKRIMELYRATWNSRAKDIFVRKRDSNAVLEAVEGDARGMGVTDASRTVVGGGSLKKLRVDGIALNAQTIRENTYPVAEPLVLYVSPDAGEEAKGFVEFMVSGENTAILRECGLVPALQGMSSGVMEAFERLYGPELDRVKSTAGGNDDLALAEELIRSARAMELNPKIRITMAETAYELASELSGGETMTFAALHFLEKEGEDREYESAKRRIDLYRRAYNATDSFETVKNYVNALMSGANAATASGRHSAAADLWRLAREVAEEHDLLERVAIERRLPGFEGRVESQEQARELTKRLTEDPEDDRTRRKLLAVWLVELDNPEKAAELVRSSDEEKIVNNIMLAVEDDGNLSAESALTLGEWYAELAGEAGPAGEELMKARARRYYQLFFSHHENRDDALAQRAELGMNKVGGRVPSPDLVEKEDGNETDFKINERITDMKLAEYVGRNLNIKRLDHRRMDSAEGITDLRPLTYLENLERLELRAAREVRDLTPLRSLPELRSLTMTGLRVEDVSELSGVRKLQVLDLSGAKDLSDLRPLTRLKELSVLKLRNCPELADPESLGELEGLRKLNMSGCHKIRDLNPLENIADSLTHLHLRDCGGINDIYPLSRCDKLEHLDLRGCDGVAEADADWLRRQLPECRIRAD